MLAEVTRSYYLPALHRLFSEELTQQENEEIFGPCSRLHGHDYSVEVTLRGKVDSETGLVISRDRMDELVDRALLSRFRNSDLNEHFEHTSGEALAVHFLQLIKEVLPAEIELRRVTLRETAKNTFIAEI